MATPLSLSEFKFEKAVLEIRYPQALLLWDRSGQLWTPLKRAYPDLKIVQAQPNQTVFNLLPDYQLKVEMDKCAIMIDEPGDLDAFGAMADVFVRSVTETLEISAVSRVGFRVTYFKEFPSRESAADALRETKRLAFPTGRLFGAPATISGGVFTVRWEDDKTGATARLDTDGRRIEYDGNFGAREFTPQNRVRHGITFDVDVFIVPTIPIGQLRPSEWIKQSAHQIRRDADSFMRG